MSDKVNAITIIFQDAADIEYADRISKAIQLFPGVIDVKYDINDVDHMIARQQAKSNLKRKIWDLLT